MKPAKIKHHLERINCDKKNKELDFDEMSNDVEKTLGSELQNSIQLDESTFGSANILMAYVRYNSPSLKCTIDEFLFAKYLTVDSKGETVLRCVEDYLNKQNVPMENITAVVTDKEGRKERLQVCEQFTVYYTDITR